MRVSGWVGSWMGGSWSELHMFIFYPCFLFPPLAAVIWEVLRKLGLRPGYDWTLSALAVRVVLWQERMVPGLHQPGGLVGWAGVLDWVQGSDLGGWGNGPELCSMSLTLGFLWNFHLMLEASFPCGKCLCPYLGSAVAPVIFICVYSYVCIYLFYHSLL